MSATFRLEDSHALLEIDSAGNVTAIISANGTRTPVGIIHTSPMYYAGAWDASTNTPTLSSGAGIKGAVYVVSVAGTTSLDGHAVWTVGDQAVFNGATWDIVQGGITSAEIVTALGYTPENVTNKDAPGGYAGLTLFKLNLRNAANTITSWFTTAATAARTWTLPDKDGTVAMTNDTLAAFAAGGAIAPASINGVTTDSTTNRPVTAASLNAGTLPIGAAAISGYAQTAGANVFTSISADFSSILHPLYRFSRFGSAVTGAIGYDGVNTATYIYNDGNFPLYLGVSGTKVAEIKATGVAVTGAITSTTTVRSGGYIVSTLPTGITGDECYVTDATTPAWNTALTGGGAVVVGARKNATVWVSF